MAAMTEQCEMFNNVIPQKEFFMSFSNYLFEWKYTLYLKFVQSFFLLFNVNLGLIT